MQTQRFWWALLGLGALLFVWNVLATVMFLSAAFQSDNYGPTQTAEFHFWSSYPPMEWRAPEIVLGLALMVVATICLQRRHKAS